MKPVVSIGAQSFEFIRENDCFYVDKTNFIKEWWESADAATLITRPRRFGKTLNLNMLECFFSNKYKGRGDLFEGLSIWNEQKYRDLQGTYPVIFLSFAGIKETNFQQTKKRINLILANLYAAHRFLLEGDFLSESEREFFGSVRMNMDESVAVAAINQLSDYLQRYYGKKVLILLDEYDTPMQEAYVNGYWNEMTAFIRSMFNSTFKTNPAMERGLMTGVTRIIRFLSGIGCHPGEGFKDSPVGESSLLCKESIFSDINNLKVITITSKKYETSFGFTEEEVMSALDAFGLSENMEKVKYWYDGFCFGNSKEIYNPWSITSYLDEKKFRTYWANTSSNGLVGKLIREGSVNVKISMEKLLDGESIETFIDEEIVFAQLDRDEEAIWSLLLTSGYLKVEDAPEDPDSAPYSLSITNLEVKRMFRRLFSGWFAEPNAKYNDFIKALFADDVGYMNEYMNRMTASVFSYFDTGSGSSEKSEPEKFYHGFVLGLISDVRLNYTVTSNRESGLGRYDVMLEPADRQKNAYVFEFKVRNPRTEKSLDETVQAALTQIKQKNYDASLTARGILPEKIRHYGFAFEGKKVLIGGHLHGE